MRQKIKEADKETYNSNFYSYENVNKEGKQCIQKTFSLEGWAKTSSVLEECVGFQQFRV